MAALERQLADLVRAPTAIATTSARAALFALLRALPRDPRRKVVVSAYTFHVVPWLIDALGYSPVFVDPRRATARPSVDQFLDAVDGDTRAVIVTHLFGHPGEAVELRRQLGDLDVLVIEDATHALGATLDGAPAGGLGHAAILSFGLGKLLPAGGGGALILSEGTIPEDAVRGCLVASAGQRPFGAHGPAGALAALVASRWALPLALGPWTGAVGHALTRRLDRIGDEPVHALGHPSGLPTVGEMDRWTAAVVLAQLEVVPRRVARLRSLDSQLRAALSDVPSIELPVIEAGSVPVPLYFRVRVPDVTRFRRAALLRGLDTKRDDMRDCGALFDRSGSRYPNARYLERHSVELPLPPRFDRAAVDRIAEIARAAVAPRACRTAT